MCTDNGNMGSIENREDRKLGFFSLNFEKLGIIETSLDELIPSKMPDGRIIRRSNVGIRKERV